MSWHFVNFYRRVKGYIFQQTSVALYKYIIFQDTPSKLIRLYQDKSYLIEVKYLDKEPLEQNYNQNKVLLWLYQQLLSKQKCLNPVDIKALIWYLIVFITILYYLVEVGIILTFGQNLWQEEKNNNKMKIINAAFFTVLCCDVIVQFRTGFLSLGMLITERERVVAHYLRFRFELDILIILIYAIAMAIDQFGINYAKTLIVLKLYRIHQFDELYLRRLSTNRSLTVIYVIFKQVAIIFILSHIIGIIFYWIDIAQIHSGICEDDPTLCWLYSSIAYSPIIELSWDLQYFYIIYWGVSTISTISYGDINSNNPISTVYCLLMMCLGFTVYGYIVNSIIKIIMWARLRSDTMKSQMILIQTYLKEIQVDSQIKHEIKQYLLFLNKEQNERNMELEEDLKKKLPTELRLELAKDAYSCLFQSLEFMMELKPTHSNLLFNIKEQIFTYNEEILLQNKIVNQLTFMTSGKIQLKCNYHNQIHTVEQIESNNEYVAQIEFFQQQKLGFTVVAEKRAEFCFIDREAFEQECRNNISFKESLKLLIYRISVCKDYQKVFYHCPECQKQHLWNQCPKKFAVFKKVNLKGKRQHQKKMLELREQKPKYPTLRYRQKLSELRSFKIFQEDQFYSHVEKRLRKIQQQIHLSRNNLQVDIAHEWKIYLPQHNLIRLKELANWKKLSKRLSRMVSFRHSL